MKSNVSNNPRWQTAPYGISTPDAAVKIADEGDAVVEKGVELKSS